MSKRERAQVSVERIERRDHIKDARVIIEEVYIKEKNWVQSSDKQIDERALEDKKVSWFIAYADKKPAGLLRVVYDPPLEIPAHLQPEWKPGFNIESLPSMGRFVEIGRFMVRPDMRGNLDISLKLMKAGVAEVVKRDYTHFITDVFEGEENSPYHFHTRILGFQEIGRHRFGELNCDHTRIILILDIIGAFARLREKGSGFGLMLTEGIADDLDARLERRRLQSNSVTA